MPAGPRNSLAVQQLPCSPAELRRLLLAAQQLQRPAKGLPGTLQAVSQLGYVQIDSINVVERAHHHVLFNRVQGYQPDMLDQLLARRQIFEYWSHAAAYLPMTDYRFSLYRKQQLLNGERHWFAPDEPLMREVKGRIAAEGPLRASDFDKSDHKNGAWWDWQPAKKALEQLFMQGELMVVRRDKFQKVFDLTERVLPAGVDCRVPTEREMAEHLVDRFLAAHLLGTATQISYLRRGIKPAVQQVLTERHANGELQSFQYQGQRYYGAPAQWDWSSLQKQQRKQVLLLNPFDNLLIQRQRLAHWFDADYQLEVYVPAAKRQFGYYSLPILWGTDYVGLVDVKADRQQGILLLQHLELNAACLASRHFQQAFARALAHYASFNACHALRLIKANPELLHWFAQTINPGD
jgi:hypothetical protein